MVHHNKMLKSSALYNSLRPPNELLRLYDVTVMLTLRLQSLSCKLLASAQIVAVLQLDWIFWEGFAHVIMLRVTMKARDRKF